MLNKKIKKRTNGNKTDFFYNFSELYNIKQLKIQENEYQISLKMIMWLFVETIKILKEWRRESDKTIKTLMSPTS